MRRSLKMLCMSMSLLPAMASADCIVYEHRDYKGASLVIGNLERVKMVRGESLGCTTNGHGGGCESQLYRPEWNDRISSYKVSRGCTLYMWEDVNERGFKLTRTGDLPYIGDRRNDEVSEAFCVC